LVFYWYIKILYHIIIGEEIKILIKLNLNLFFYKKSVMDIKYQKNIKKCIRQNESIPTGIYKKSTIIT